MAALEHYYRELATGRRRGALDRLLLAALALPAFCYGMVLSLRALAYRLGIFSSYRLPRPVISVGNITVGGTGKTPMVALLARYFLARGKRVVVLSRGYGGTSRGAVRIAADGRSVLLSAEEAGDEPYLLATSVPGLMVVIGADRYRAGLAAMEKLNPDVFILDDGFQHLRLQRDLNILLLDAGAPFGNGRTFPAGLLRELPAAASRADFVVFSRCQDNRRVAAVEKPSCCASHCLTGARLLPEGREEPFAVLRPLRGVAFAGIAEPAVFFDSLTEAGLQLVASLAFPDHSRYGEAEIDALVQLRERFQADYFITTGKDGVKLAPYLERLGKVYAAGLEMRLTGGTPLEEALAGIVK